MRRLPAASIALVLVVSLAIAACGEEETHEVVEGEPLELGELSYNVQLTRFLNPDDPEDSEYLVGQPEPEPRTDYLGVFMVIENHDDEEAHESASEFTVHDTEDNRYEPLETDTPYALEIGATVPAEGQLPLLDTTAQTGPVQGSLLIFRVDEIVSENRPLKLLIKGEESSGEVILDL
ncbi:MAG TPA: hypothetical protein VHF58_07925 [Solirubrobacterales bacterium]|nr:hypothetical protein [Solirubrobacterales bacterium]